LPDRLPRNLEVRRQTLLEFAKVTSNVEVVIGRQLEWVSELELDADLILRDIDDLLRHLKQLSASVDSLFFCWRSGRPHRDREEIVELAKVDLQLLALFGRRVPVLQRIAALRPILHYIHLLVFFCQIYEVHHRKLKLLL